LILISVSVLVLVLHSLVSVLASVSLCSGLVSSLKESTTKIGYLSDVLSVSDAVGLYCLEPDRLFFEFILLIAFFSFIASGGASATKEPGYFEARTSSSHVTRMHFFLKKIEDQNTKAANAAENVSLSQ